jgi:hypothetical protein
MSLMELIIIRCIIMLVTLNTLKDRRRSLRQFNSCIKLMYAYIKSSLRWIGY